MNQDLQQIIGFSDVDLESNRNGAITDHQRDRLSTTKTYEFQSLAFGLGLILILIIPICGICAILFNIPAILASLSSAIIALGLMSIGVVIALLFYANWRGIQERSMLPDVAVTEDQQLDFQREQRGAHEIYYVLAGDQRFNVDYEIYIGLQSYQRNKPLNLIYRIDHTPHNPQILSIELINSGPALS